VPLHVWLPLAHPGRADARQRRAQRRHDQGRAVGLAAISAAGRSGLPDWGNVCLVAGLVTAFYGVVVGVTQRNAKAVLAYSSISQMGLLTLGIGGGLSAPAAWPVISAAVLIYALHHGLSKGCLFLSVGVARG
jgi:formate hydrogenlyase subunit 3/multisubunit Na+/H+ antiporter MnhD subunit